MGAVQDGQRVAKVAGAPPGERETPRDWKWPQASGAVQTRAIPVWNEMVSQKGHLKQLVVKLKKKKCRYSAAASYHVWAQFLPNSQTWLACVGHLQQYCRR